MTRFCCGIFLFFILLSRPGMAQQTAGCELPASQSQPSGVSNIFNEQQENWLGEILLERLSHDTHIVHDPELNGYLQRLGDHLVGHMPPSSLHFQFGLVEIPEVNAFSLPGGYVFISRKMVSFAQSEDELAAVLAHELGHIYTHQGAIRMTQLFKEVLNVTSVSDKADISNKYNLLLERTRKKPIQMNNDREQDQIVADRMGVFALALSGYNPAGLSQFWDRFAETKGKTGSAWSDFFLTTTKESRRLREMLKQSQNLPAGCKADLPPPASNFTAWQAHVIAANYDQRPVALSRDLPKSSLEPALRDELTHVRFSPDKAFIMAQDEAGIFVLQTDPLKFLFHINAPGARPAKFSPDSSTLSFFTEHLRVETWDLATQQRRFVAEVASRSSDCIGMDLSPDGKYIACVNLVRSTYDIGVKLDFRIIDTASSEVYFEKKGFYTIDWVERVRLAMQIQLEDRVPQLFTIHFSPGGKYVVAGREGNVIALEMGSKQVLNLPSRAKSLLSNSFTFVGEDRILGMNYNKPEDSFLFRFPSGEMLANIPIGRQAMEGATRGNFVMMRPINKYPVGVMDLEKKSLMMGYKRSAFDLYNDLFVTDTPASEVQLSRLKGDKIEPIGLVALPRGPLANVETFALSPDARYLALAEKTQGAVWDLEKQSRVLHMRGFRGAYIDSGSRFFALFPKQEETEPQLGVFDLHSGSPLGTAALHEEDHPAQYGRIFIVKRPKNKDVYTSQVTWEFHDVLDGRKLWERSFNNDIPYLSSVGKTTVFRWLLGQDTAKSVVNHDPHLAAQASRIPERESSYLLEFYDTESGQVQGRMLIDSGNGSFRIRSAAISEDWVVVTDNLGRTLLYSLSEGTQKAHFFGRHPVLVPGSNLLFLRNDQDELDLIDIKSGEKKQHFAFPAPVAATVVAAGAKKALVLTTDQNVYWVDLSGENAVASQ
jgi:hypothetical protein